ncbi:VOC family protein [Altericroceibacterium spongiae]|uniref:VOC family protein n=1 Tax=Altericroceibacterium spongiae TaxID=2320269 RepID=A0A420EQV8_9SPHN|nr:VOC family protein [Altericroceibacterium spongiae]RKF23063.1 VOC family protein [Altericroceibacterium spongiae]
MTDDLHAIALTLNVSDLERSVRFYCEALGFAEGKTVERGSEAARTLEMENCQFRMCFLARPDIRLLLIQLEDPLPVYERPQTPANQLGPIMMSFSCPDPSATGKAITELGGKMIHEGISANGRFNLALVADPDGTRIELNSIPHADVLGVFPAK